MKFIKTLFSPKLRSRTFSFLMCFIFFAIMQGLSLTGNLSSLMKGLLVPLSSYVIAAIALNLTVGILGELSLGQAGFMSVGAFSGAITIAVLMQNGIGKIPALFIAIFVGTICAALCGLLVGIPVLKLQGDYLAIVTLAFGQIIKTLLGNLYVGIDSNGLQMSYIIDKTNIAIDGRMVIDGPIGITQNPRITTFPIAFAFVIITLIIVYNVIYSKQGRAIMACRDNKIAALSVGINTTKFKLMTFVISAALGGLAGVLYGMNYAAVVPAKFDFNLSILLLVYVVLGGLGNINGTIIATTALLIIPEKLRSLNDYRMIIYAVILIMIMLIKNNEAINNVYTKLSTNIKNKFSSVFKKKGAN